MDATQPRTATVNESTISLNDYFPMQTKLLIFTELEKLKTYALGKTVNGDMVKELVSENAANSLQLANAIRLGNLL
jgi:DNA polymerase III subunit delta